MNIHFTFQVHQREQELNLKHFLESTLRWLCDTIIMKKKRVDILENNLIYFNSKEQLLILKYFTLVWTLVY